MEIDLAYLPALDGAMACLQDEYLNRAHRTNFDYVKNETNLESVAGPLKWLTVDPQTSGGLLLSVPENHAEEILKRIKPFFDKTDFVGRVVARGQGPRLHFK
jgi:selenide,water dikinase